MLCKKIKADLPIQIIQIFKNSQNTNSMLNGWKHTKGEASWHFFDKYYNMRLPKYGASNFLFHFWCSSLYFDFHKINVIWN
jgi:hypothetical protein